MRGPRPWVAITVAIIGLVGTLVSALIARQRAAEARALRWVVRVFYNGDGLDGAAIQGLATNGQPFEGATYKGARIFLVEPDMKSELVTLSVRKDGYSDWHGQATISDISPTDVMMVRAGVEVVSVPASTAVTSSSTTTSTTIRPVDRMEKLFQSGPKTSGSMKSFSGPYVLCSEPAPAGYAVVDAQFYLSGDRQCNAWSTCRQTEQTESRVCWEFTLQGHNEWAPPGQAFSEGFLRVVYARQG